MNKSSLWIVLQKMRMPFIVIVTTYTISMIGLLIISGVDGDGKPYQMSIFDAFYFLTYTATTIGFGEIPYAFTYPQRMWVSFSIYFNVLGWFYGIGVLVALVQDKQFLENLSVNKFVKQVRRLKEDFIVVLGYNLTTEEIIKKAIDDNLRVVVIEKDENKVNNLILESYIPVVPVLCGDVRRSEVLRMAGIESVYCKGLVSMFDSDALNLRVATTSKIINPRLKMAIKSTTQNFTENLKDIDVNIVVNPFKIVSNHLRMAIVSPHILKLEEWIYGHKFTSKIFKLPQGEYIICGYGRFGKSIYEALKDSGVGVSFIDIDSKCKANINKKFLEHIKIGDADDREVLNSVGIKEARVIIAGTNDDTTNLSILATARKLNSNIFTIARDNEMEDFSIFKKTKVDYIFAPAKTLIKKTFNALINPTADMFIKEIRKMSDKECADIIKQISTIDKEPTLIELEINSLEAVEVTQRLRAKEILEYDILRKSLTNSNFNNNILILLISRGENKLLMPSWSENIQINDKLLVVCDNNAKEDIELILNNHYEFIYAQTGKEKKWIFG
ncbi:MAG: hypothetical protein KN64_04220 [Sulfurovum sp. AS07-7]|nr:MAG: hypothetical protein KN64_04220 [Sulfurovum sp. AS07-7]